MKRRKGSLSRFINQSINQSTKQTFIHSMRKIKRVVFGKLFVKDCKSKEVVCERERGGEVQRNKRG